MFQYQTAFSFYIAPGFFHIWSMLKLLKETYLWEHIEMTGVYEVNIHKFVSSYKIPTLACTIYIQEKIWQNKNALVFEWDKYGIIFFYLESLWPKVGYLICL